MVTAEALCRSCGFEQGACNCIELLPGPQTDFVRSEAKHPGLFGGRGSCKTVSSIVKGFKYISDHPGAQGVLTSPTFPMLRQTLLPAIREFFGSEEGRKWEYKRGDMEIQFVDGSVIYLRPAEEPGAFRGMTLAFFGMDEIAEGLQHETFLTLQPALRQKGFRHQGWVTSTPHWRRPWLRKVWKEHANAVTGEPLEKEDYPIFQADTAENWHLPEGYLRHLQESYGDTTWADQELHGAFVIVEGAGFPQFSEAVHVRYPPPALRWKRRGIAGIDFGATSPTAMYELGLDESGKIWALREFYKRNADDYDWVKTVRDWEVKLVVCDPSRSDKDIYRLENLYGVNLMRAPHKQFDVRVRLMRSLLNVKEDGNPGMYITPDCPNLIYEIPNLAFDSPRGQAETTDSWMSGSLDHGFDAFCYGAQELVDMPLDWKTPRLVEHGVLA